MAKSEKKNRGISMIVVLWIMAILTVLATATTLMTQGDISSTINLVKRKGALNLAESGSDYFISLIPDNSLMMSTLVSNENRPFGSISDTFAVYRVEVNDERSFVLAPVPFRAFYKWSPGGSGTYFAYDFSSGGIMGAADKVLSPQKIVDVVAGIWLKTSGGERDQDLPIY